MTDLYRTIVADPPWPIGFTRYGTGGRRRQATTVPYGFMSLAAISELPVASFAAEESHPTRRLFREGAAATVARSWGFEPCGEIIWGLRNPGLGGALGNGHEPVLIARRGSSPFRASWPVGVVFWPQPYDSRGKMHSAKPDAFLDLVEELSPGPYLEMFARRQRLGWDTWGDEALNHLEMPA